jgi:hypothetical protein
MKMPQNPFEQNQGSPQIPTWHCNACDRTEQVVRHWVQTGNMGWQIVIDWRATERLTRDHQDQHGKELISGIEAWLDAAAGRSGEQG